MTNSKIKEKKIKGRGSLSSPDGRYLGFSREEVDDGWDSEHEQQKITTTVSIEKSKTIIARNQSPDIPFEQSINPYRGCEHGCIYCYARPSHAYFDLSPGIDFETKLFVKTKAAGLLKQELASASYQCSPIALGTNTDPYQPIERQYKITRQIIELLNKHNHPLTIVTKSGLVERDIDLLTPMAEKNLVQVFISITTLDTELMRKMEPRATAPYKRLQTIKCLVDAGIPTGMMFAPVIPVINDYELENILEKSADAGAINAGYVLIRLPYEIKSLFREWLDTHYPLKTSHVMNMIKDIRGGRENDPEFHSRITGKGVFATLIKNRFNKTCKRLGLNSNQNTVLDTSQFIKPVLSGQQISLF
ncbi:MAG: PA0069 family radical SAM protein [Proteobacteria bacterium]|nr:PA0069 family radical SAM protein [Pseudomonadota bacterium]